MDYKGSTMSYREIGCLEKIHCSPEGANSFLFQDIEKHEQLRIDWGLQKAFEKPEIYMSSPNILSQPRENKDLFLYLGW